MRDTMRREIFHSGLVGSRVAILATHGYESSELLRPLTALRLAGAEAVIVSISQSPDRIRGWDQGEWGGSVRVDRTVQISHPDDFNALLLPGGVMSPDQLRMDADAVSFVRGFIEAGKPVAAICHAPWMLVEAGAAEGRRMTSHPSLRTDLENAGAEWVDEEVVVDSGVVTSRRPDDLDAFIAKMFEEIQEGVHLSQG